MISQTFLDLTVLIMKTGHDVWDGNDATVIALESFFKKKYDKDEVVDAIEYFVQQNSNNLVEIPDDYECERVH